MYVVAQTNNANWRALDDWRFWKLTDMIWDESPL